MQSKIQMTNQVSKPQTKNTKENSLVSFARRPVELNHIPSSGTNRVSIGSQNRLTSTSPYLRNNNYNISENKNHLFITELKKRFIIPLIGMWCQLIPVMTSIAEPYFMSRDGLWKTKSTIRALTVAEVMSLYNGY